MGILRLLLWLLPRDAREDFGGELMETAAQRWRDQGPTLSPAGRLLFWTRQWRAALRASLRLRRGGPILGAADRRMNPKEDVMDGVWKDMRHSFRSLATRPGFTFVAVLTLALGIGATTAMFSAVNSVLLRELPYRDAEEIVVLHRTDIRDGSVREGVSAANMRDVGEAATTVASIGVADPFSFDLMEDGRAVALRGWNVSEGYLEALGAKTVLGRTFSPEEFAGDGAGVVMLSHNTWMTRFGGDPSIVGQELVLNGSAQTVVGVFDPDFKYPSTGEVWSTRPVQPWDERSRPAAYMAGVARLTPGTTVAQAQTEISRIAADLGQVHPGANASYGLRLTPLRQHLFGDVESPLFLLMAAVGLVLLIAAANVAGLQLARGAGRSREFALRGALGAGSRRILRLVATESLVLAGAGGALGVALAFGGIEIIEMLGPNHLPRIEELSIDGTVLSFALIAALGSALFAGIAPALKASRMNLNLALTEGSRGSTSGRRSGTLRDRLVTGEIALALVLAIGAGLLVRSFDRLMDTELGFQPEGRLAMQVFAYDDQGNVKVDFIQRSLEEIEALPGVEAVALTTNLPLADDASISSIDITTRFTIDDRAAPTPGDEPVTSFLSIDGMYPEVMGIELTAGRMFNTADNSESAPVVLVNEAFVRRHFSGEDPLGKSIRVGFGGGVSREIVGVLADTRPQGFESEPRVEVFAPLTQVGSASLTFVVKTVTDPATMVLPVQEALWSVDPTQSVWAAMPMSDLLVNWTRQRRFNTALLVAFAGLALMLAAIGVYGLMSFSVEQRVNEMGIRRALGGGTGDILGMVLRRGLMVAVTGVGIGLAGAFAATRLLSGMLYGVEPFDPVTFAGLAVAVVAVAVFAAFLPARRATKVDPMVALRAD